MDQWVKWEKGCKGVKRERRMKLTMGVKEEDVTKGRGLRICLWPLFWMGHFRRNSYELIHTNKCSGWNEKWSEQPRPFIFTPMTLDTIWWKVTQLINYTQTVTQFTEHQWKERERERERARERGREREGERERERVIHSFALLFRFNVQLWNVRSSECVCVFTEGFCIRILWL